MNKILIKYNLNDYNFCEKNRDDVSSLYFCIIRNVIGLFYLGSPRFESALARHLRDYMSCRNLKTDLLPSFIFSAVDPF